MDKELTEIARRFVACPGWVFLPGMVARTELRAVGRVDGVDPTGLIRVGGRTFGTPSIFPDLDDPLTRLGGLAVVRMAWNDPHAFVRFFDRTPLEGHWFWECGTGSRRQCGFVADVKHGELLSMLVAMESAPK